ncbi:MAG TPA: hypothetical protein VFZ47_08090, partial [Chitinophagaceae bacterium]
AIVKPICFGKLILYYPEVVVLFQTGSAYRTFVGDIGVTGQAVCHRDGVFLSHKRKEIGFYYITQGLYTTKHPAI